ncbi:hypothetical protein AAFN47_17765 [Hoeflea sp. CAU 1731]
MRENITGTLLLHFMRFCAIINAFEQRKATQISGLPNAIFRIPETKPKRRNRHLPKQSQIAEKAKSRNKPGSNIRIPETKPGVKTRIPETKPVSPNEARTQKDDLPKQSQIYAIHIQLIDFI